MSAFRKLDQLIEREVKTREAARAAVWDALWERRPIGRVAVRVQPSEARIGAAKDVIRALDLPEPPVPCGWTPEWREALLGDLAVWLAGWQAPGDAFPSPNIPRFVHGQSQGVCDLFGARLEAQPDGNMYVHPLPADPERVAAIEPRPPETSMYWGAIEYVLDHAPASQPLEITIAEEEVASWNRICHSMGRPADIVPTI